MPSGAKLDVGRLQVAVDDSMVVRRLERLGDLFRDAQCVVERDGAARNRCARSSPSTSSMTRARMSPRFLKAVDIGDVRMVERREGLRFACETCEAVRVAVNGVPQDLDRNVSISLVSRARYTSPMPPAPIGATISYGPRRVPADNGMKLNRL